MTSVEENTPTKSRRAIITDSPPISDEIVILTGFLARLGYKVEVVCHGSCQKSKECGYRATASAFNMSAPGGFLNLGEDAKHVTPDELIKFFNKVLCKSPLSTAEWLSDNDIKLITCNVEFLQNNFELKCINDAHRLYDSLVLIGNALVDAAKQVESYGEPLIYTADSLNCMSHDLKDRAKEGLFKELLNEFVEKIKKAEKVDFQQFSNKYSELRLLKNPFWFEGVGGFREFQEYILYERQQTDRPLHRSRSANVNTGDRPGGRHWFTVTREHTEESRPSFIAKAVAE